MAGEGEVGESSRANLGTTSEQEPQAVEIGFGSVVKFQEPESGERSLGWSVVVGFTQAGQVDDCLIIDESDENPSLALPGNKFISHVDKVLGGTTWSKDKVLKGIAKGLGGRQVPFIVNYITDRAAEERTISIRAIVENEPGSK